MTSTDRPPTTDVLSALRTATAARHAELDAGMPLAVAEPGLADYAQHLHLIQAWLVPIEAWLGGHQDGPQNPTLLPPRWRAARVASDLAHPLLAPWPAPAAETTEAAQGIQPQWPQWPQWPSPASAAYRWGVVYVVEGAQLGGALLYRRLAEPLAPHPLAYLAGDGPEVGPRWQQMVHTLSRAVSRRLDVAAACQGACDAFDRLLALRAQWAAMAAATAPEATMSPALSPAEVPAAALRR